MVGYGSFLDFLNIAFVEIMLVEILLESFLAQVRFSKAQSVEGSLLTS